MKALPRLDPQLRSGLCLLDDEPSWLAQPRMEQGPEETRDVFLNPDNHYEWGNDTSVVWVRDRAVESATPYRAGGRFRDLIDGFRTNRGTPRARSILASADILIDNRHAMHCELRREELAYTARFFAARGYAPLSGLIHPFHVGSLRLHYRRLLRTGGMTRGDNQSPLRYVVKNDPLATLHHVRLTETVCAVAGRRVKPSYLYVSAYQGGASLPRHVDRAQCEYSISFCLDFTPDPRHETPWPLHLDTPDGTQTIYQTIGDALIYRGRTLPHYRDALPPGQSSTSIFFHYVDEGFKGDLR